MEKSEEKIVGKIVSLFHELAEGKSPLRKKDGKNIHWVFDFEISGKKYQCKTGKTITYNLPTGETLHHETDIFIINSENMTTPYILNPKEKFVSIEVKHKSSVTDQFKSRSYDMMHLRSTYPKCYGVMMYIREKNISLQQAKKISYPYHRFFGCSTKELSAKKLSPFFNEIVLFLGEK